MLFLFVLREVTLTIQSILCPLHHHMSDIEQKKLTIPDILVSVEQTFLSSAQWTITYNL